MERGDNAFEDKFTIGLVCRGVKVWDYNNGISDSGMLSEAVRETGFCSGMPYGSYIIDILIAFTAQPMQAGGYAYLGGSACIVKAQSYDYDDNTVQHEVSHLYWARDHKTESDPDYWSDCIMSYREVFVGWWIFGSWIPMCYLTNNWCGTCYNTIYTHRHKF